VTPRARRILLVAALAAVATLILAPAALASAGGGSAGFSGGGGGGFGGGGGGGGGRGFEIYILFQLLFRIAALGHGLGLLFLIGLGLLYWFMRSGGSKLQQFWRAREQRGSASRREARRRERKVELAAAEAADVDPIFDPEHVRAAAGALFTSIQFAWDADDRAALRGLVAPELLAMWERRLDDFASRGWRNRTQPLGEPQVEYVGILRRGAGADADARVVVRIEARIHDFVVDARGRHLKRNGQFTETVRLREFWTLQRRGDRWVLASIEQGAEGKHSLSDQIVATPWADGQALRDEALIEGAVADAVPAGTSVSEIAPLEFSGGAEAAASDLSLADGRFAPDVLEVAARRAVAAWAEAVDGSERRLREIAEPAAVSELLHPGDPSRRTRLVVRGPAVKRIRVTGLDAHSEPPTMTIDVEVRGCRYIEEVGTTRVLAGNPARPAEFSERWTLALSGDQDQPWRIALVGAPARAA
jgi:predicted lipid-binding transport protein (Tim44 family)